MNRIKGYFVLFGFVMLLGCGDGLSRVVISGTLKSQSGPVANAIVQFYPRPGTPGEGAIGMCDERGNFTVISSRKANEGLPPGKYTVRATRMISKDGIVLPATATQAEHPDARESVPAPYSTPASPIEVEISEKGGALEIEIPAKVTGKLSST
ncbi:MAG: carboxypeptidase-like regulatory domain-containing protein [Pirellula sp.]